MIVQILDPSNYTPSIYSLPTAIVSLVVFILGLVNFIRENASRISLAFFILTLVYSEWFFAFTFLYSSNNDQVGLFWAKAAYIGIPCIPAATYMFVTIGLGIYRQWSRVAWAVWVLALMFSIVIISTDALIGSLYHYWWGYYPKYRLFSIPFLIYFFLVLTAASIHAIMEYRKASPGSIFQKRTKFTAIALAIAGIGVVDFVAKYGIPLYPFAYAPFTVYLIMLIWSIRHFRMVEITPAFAANEILDIMSDALFAVDMEGDIRMINKAACDLFDRAEEECIGRPANEVVSRDFFLSRFNTGLKGRDIRNYEIKLAAKDGNMHTLSLSASTIYEMKEYPVGVLFVARDITELKDQEARLKRANNELRERQRISWMEMSIASNLQSRIFPNQAPSNGDWDSAFLFRPMHGISGDLYDFYTDDTGLRGAGIFDVSGHGISAGLITILARSIISRNFNSMISGNLRFVFEGINKDLITEIGSIDTYLTGILLRFKGKKVEYVNAGHPDLFIKREKSGAVSPVKPRDREIKGQLLGKEITDEKFDVLAFNVAQGDVLLLYTDGLVGCTNADGKIYGTSRLAETLKNSPAGSAKEILDFISTDFNNFIRNNPLRDDVSALVLKRK